MSKASTKDRSVKEWNFTLLITSHNLREIERLCERIAIMNKGRIIAVGTLDELHAKSRCFDTYRFKVQHIGKGKLRHFIELCNALQPVRIINSNSEIELEVNFKQGSSGFSRLIQLIINEGGEISKCIQVSNSFDNIFQTLVEDHINQVEIKKRL